MAVPDQITGGGKPTDAPDFTKGGVIPEGMQTDWHLGATGARGYIHSIRMSTAKTRQVLITSVAEGSPADGILKKGDVILGVDRELSCQLPADVFALRLLHLPEEV